VNYTGSLQLSDADATLPADWGWKEAFYLDAVVNGGRRRVVMVPFAEAGQKSDAVEVWIERRN
jgi:hypothetical protein